MNPAVKTCLEAIHCRAHNAIKHSPLAMRMLLMQPSEWVTVCQNSGTNPRKMALQSHVHWTDIRQIRNR